MANCENCGKGKMFGHTVSHAKNRTRRIYRPNLHHVKIVVGGVRQKMLLCSKCVRKLKKEGAINYKAPGV